MTKQLYGYRRENGAVGVRNYVAIIPVDDISNAAAQAVSENIRGTLALTHPYGRLQFSDDLDLFFRQMIGTGRNPNIAAAVVIGIEPEWTNKLANGIAETGKPVEAFSIERYGDHKTIERASRAAKKLIHKATEQNREPIELSELVISAKCGESDTTSGLASNPAIGKVIEQMVDAGGTVLFGETSELTGGEDLVAERFKSDEDKQKFKEIFNEYNEFIKEEHANLMGSQPTKGNIRGGLSTIEEKAMGNIEKIGEARIDGVLNYAEAPEDSGLYFMNTSSAAAEAVTLFAAGGSVLHLFTTGQGNVVGNPVIPVLKISGNQLTVDTMDEHIDVDVTGIMELEESVAEAGEKVRDKMEETINGRLTAAEVLGHEEFVLTKLFRSA